MKTSDVRKLLSREILNLTYEQKNKMKKLLEAEIAGLPLIITVEEAAKITGYKTVYVHAWLKAFVIDGVDVVTTRSIVNFFSTNFESTIPKSRWHKKLIKKAMK